MWIMGDMPSIDRLRQEANSVRRPYDVVDTVGECDCICRRLMHELHSSYDIPYDELSVEQGRIGPKGEEIHFILVVSGDWVETESQTVWIDLSLDQFCDRHRKYDLVDVSLGESSEIDSVRVMEDNDERRSTYMSFQRYLDITL